MNYVPVVRRLLEMPSSWGDREIYGSGAGSLTFGELRDGMLLVAGWLAAEGMQAGDRVAVCLPKSLETVRAIYGILAAGAAYVPLPMQGPTARLQAMLASIEPQLVLATPEIAAQLRRAGDGSAAPPARTIEIGGKNGDVASLVRGLPARRTIAEVSPDGLAAVYFTSGSTGKPKGVMWSHRGMDAATAALPRGLRITDADRLISASPLHYSASAEIFFSLHSGAGTFLLSDREAMFPDHVAAAMERGRITVWSGTATAWRLLVEGGGLATRDLRPLRRVEFYGERMPIPALRQAMAALPQAEFCNLYAASEAFHMIEFPVPRPLPEDLASLPLGRSTQTYEVTLRDADGNEVAPGETGEICVAGSPVMLGYWREPELTAARRLEGRADSYRTGDLAFLGEDGLLHLVGRSDQLVKLRGHRFELGEIEAALKAHPSVREAVAFAVPGSQGETEIRAAVLVADAGDPGDGLRLHCRRKLPNFAQPARIAALSNFPLLSTGKIDRQALKAMVAGE